MLADGFEQVAWKGKDRSAAPTTELAGYLSREALNIAGREVCVPSLSKPEVIDSVVRHLVNLEVGKRERFGDKGTEVRLTGAGDSEDEPD